MKTAKQRSRLFYPNIWQLAVTCPDKSKRSQTRLFKVEMKTAKNCCCFVRWRCHKNSKAVIPGHVTVDVGKPLPTSDPGMTTLQVFAVGNPCSAAMPNHCYTAS